MNKISIIIALIITISQVNAEELQPNYNDKNGTIIFEREENNISELLRKCVVGVEIGDLAEEEERIIYDHYDSKIKIGVLEDNQLITTLEIYRIDYLDKAANRWGSPSGEIWYKIKSGTLSGWICVTSEFISKSDDPFYDNNWEILGTIKGSNKDWTIRKIVQLVSVWENLNIRNNPGITGNKVLYTIKPNDTDPLQTNVNVIAMTEEKETIDGRNDHWLKIEYKGYTGWIFGGYASVERGGPKYYIPEYRVDFELGWY